MPPSSFHVEINFPLGAVTVAIEFHSVSQCPVLRDAIRVGTISYVGLLQFDER